MLGGKERLTVWNMKTGTPQEDQAHRYLTITTIRCTGVRVNRDHVFPFV
jgi:hypothetical protein